MELVCQSQGLTGTWIYCEDHNFMFDCGEGAATYLVQKVGAIRSLFISHSHTDHISGLQTVIYLRRRMENSAKLSIYYPGGDSRIAELRKFVGNDNQTEWVGIPIKAKIPLKIVRGTEVFNHPTLYVENFLTDHATNSFSMGFRLMESRTRLRPDLAGTPGPVLAELKKTEDINQHVCVRHIAFTSDTLPTVDTTELEGAELLIHDATYLSAEDRPPGSRHSTWEEAQALGVKARCKRIVGCHVSARYRSYVDTPWLCATGDGLLHPGTITKIVL